jgi:hypothetical protein
MPRLTTRTCIVLAGLAMAVACDNAGNRASNPASPPRNDSASSPQSDRNAAFESAARLESRVAEARTFVATAGSDPAKLTRGERLQVSDVRRAIVAANVALQKAREALGAGDAATSRQVSEAATERLSGILATKPADRPPAAARETK